MRSFGMHTSNMRFDYSKLRNPITIYDMQSVIENGMPQKPRPVVFLECFAHIESVSLKDYATSVQTGSEDEIKVFIRNYKGIHNKMTIKDLVTDVEYQIKDILYNYRRSGFTIIVAKGVDL